MSSISGRVHFGDGRYRATGADDPTRNRCSDISTSPGAADPPEAVVVMVIPERLEIWLETTVLVVLVVVEVGSLAEPTVLYPLYQFGVAVGGCREFISLMTWRRNNARNVLSCQEGGW